MTKRDVFIQILSEVTGLSRKEVESKVSGIFRQMETLHPGSTKGFNATMTDAEAEALLTKMRKGKEGILNWLVQGAVQARRAGVRRAHAEPWR